MLSHFPPAAQNLTPPPYILIPKRGGYGAKPHPIDRAKKSFKPTRAAENQLVRKQMLVQTLPAAQNLSPHYPIYHAPLWGMG